MRLYSSILLGELLEILQSRFVVTTYPCVEHEAHVATDEVHPEFRCESPNNCGVIPSRCEVEVGIGFTLRAKIKVCPHPGIELTFNNFLVPGSNLRVVAYPIHFRAHT